MIYKNGAVVHLAVLKKAEDVKEVVKDHKEVEEVKEEKVKEVEPKKEEPIKEEKKEPKKKNKKEHK